MVHDLSKLYFGRHTFTGSFMTSFMEQLRNAKNGNAILFCGAGFTADCLNYNCDEEIGTGGQLLNLFNSKLLSCGKPSGYRDLKNAADKLEEAIGEHGMLALLTEIYRLRNVSADMVSTLRFPWQRIYTTNYDNGVELGLFRAGKDFKALTNSDVPQSASNIVDVVHLHGFVDYWTIKNFKKSCILGSASYHSLDGVSEWLSTFRDDIDRAEAVVFVGFNASDFHLNQVLFNLSEHKKKISFINRAHAEPDLDVSATQSQFGTPFYFGRQGLAEKISQVLLEVTEKPPSLSSLKRYERPIPSSSIPSVEQIEELFLFGKISLNQISRDNFERKSDFHVRRAFTDILLSQIKEVAKIVLLVGEICDGKSIIIESLSQSLATGRPVFRMRHQYDDLLEEVSRVIHHYKDAAIFIEDCFDLSPDRLLSLAQLFQSSNGVLILTSRNIAMEAANRQVISLGQLSNFRKFPIPKLTDSEAECLVTLVDQIAGWRDLSAVTREEKMRFITGNCGRSLPKFLIRLLKSKYVRDIYRAEYNKSDEMSRNERDTLIMALYISHIGQVAPIGFLSDLLQFDVGAMLDRYQKQQGSLRLIRRDRDNIQTLPAIGSTSILEVMVPDSEIIDTLVSVLERLAQKTQLTDFEQHMYVQIMRYSILQSVVSDRDQVNRFFDHVSKIDYFRRQVLFWLQWHMAKSDMKDFPNAEKYLLQGYREALAYEKKTGKSYNRKQLDDRKAKFLMLRAQNSERIGADLFREFKDAYDIVGRSLGEVDLTYHTFETLLLVAQTFVSQSPKLSKVNFDIVLNNINSIIDKAGRKVVSVVEGYQRNTAERAFRESVNSMKNVTNQNDIQRLNES
jgi:SIR2-like domain